MIKRELFYTLILLLLLAACSNQEEPTPLPTEEPTAVASPSPVASPTAAATPTLMPSPTPIRPAITVSEQTLTEDGRLSIDALTAVAPGWAVVYTRNEGRLGTMVGYAAVEAGESQEIELTVAPMLATPQLTILLYEGEGELANLAEPLQPETAVAEADFAVEIDVPIPFIAIADQTIAEDGVMQIEAVYAPADSWLVIHADDNGGLGKQIGALRVDAGTSEELTVAVSWRDATPLLHAVLLEDSGAAETMDDLHRETAVMIGEEPVAASFHVVLPPDILAYHQPMIDDAIVIERVLSPGAGWVVVYDDPATTSAGLIVGFAHVDEGLNENLTIDISTPNLENLYLLLLADSDPVGEFDVPGVDLPLRTADGRLPDPFVVNTTPRPYLLVTDQLLTSDGDELSVTIPLTVADTPLWLAIHADADGELGEILGFTAVEPGINRQVVVSIDPHLLTETLHATFYTNAGDLESFDPDGEDVPLLISGRNRVSASFTATQAE